ncbi:MAG: hypothetical protein ACRDHZ_26495, partial [Ktedonobacteraceae bacterium]
TDTGHPYIESNHPTVYSQRLIRDNLFIGVTARKYVLYGFSRSQQKKTASRKGNGKRKKGVPHFSTPKGCGYHAAG